MEGFSACAAFQGPVCLRHMEHVDSSGENIRERMEQAAHIVWATVLISDIGGKGDLIMKKYDLERFIIAQKRDFAEALGQVRAGRKTSHWIWYIFPQMKGLGMSGMSDYYGIKSLEEAKAFMEDKFLRENLLQISSALLSLESQSANKIFGYPDNLKVCSCMTLFAHAAPQYPVFRDVLDKYYNGREDIQTLRLLGIM